MKIYSHFWICLWLALIFMSTLFDISDVTGKRIASALDRIEMKLGSARQ